MKNGSCKGWRCDSIIIKDQFLGSVEFFFAFTPEDLNPLILHLTLSALTFFPFFMVCVFWGGGFLFVLILT